MLSENIGATMVNCASSLAQNGGKKYRRTDDVANLVYNQYLCRDLPVSSRLVGYREPCLLSIYASQNAQIQQQNNTTTEKKLMNYYIPLDCLFKTKILIPQS